MSYENDVIDFMTGQADPNIKPWGGESNISPVGTHKVKVIEATQETSSNKNPQLVLSFEVTGGEHDGARIRGYYMLMNSGAAEGRLKQVREACSVSLINAQGAFRRSDFVGKVCLIDVASEGWEKPDPVSGQMIQKTALRVRNERAA